MRRRILCLLTAVFVTSSLLGGSPAEAESPNPYLNRLVELFRQTFHDELRVEPTTEATESVVFEGRTIVVTTWQASSSKGRAQAFAAPDSKTVLGVINLEPQTADIWQLAARDAASGLDTNVVGFPLGQRSGLGLGDLICAGVTGGGGTIICGLVTGADFFAGVVCGSTASVVGSGICAGGNERSGRAQWAYREDDPLGLKGSYVEYSSNYPYEGVHYNGENFLCVRSEHLSDWGCYRPRQTGPSTVVLDRTWVNYRSVIKWSDGSKTTQYFGTNQYNFWPDIVWHQGGYFPNVVRSTIQIRTDQRYLLPTGAQQWVYVDTVTALTATCGTGTTCT